MKQPTKSMLQVDAILQGIMIIPMLIAYLAGLFDSGSGAIGIALFLQFFLGCFQLLSGLVRSIRHGSTLRTKYLIVAITYVLALITGTVALPQLHGVIMAVIFGIVIPCMIAVWYWGITIMQANGSFKEVIEDKTKNLSTLAIEEDEDMIIDNILMRHKKRIKI